MSIPIFFIHTGYSPYLEFSIRQAAISSPDSRIFLLGDHSNDRFANITHVNMRDYFSSAKDFGDIYSHMSTNPHDYELFCIQRWFVLNEYLRDTGITRFFVCDSDVMLYEDINIIADRDFRDRDIALYLHHGDGDASAGLALMKSKTLNDMCSFFSDSYTDPGRRAALEDKWRTVREAKILGGVSDMTLVNNFLQTLPDSSYAAINQVHNNSTFDWNINSPLGYLPDEYQMASGKKHLVWKNRIPFCLNTHSGELVRFNALHFQGPAKYLSASCYTGNNFPGIHTLKIKFALLELLASLYSKYRIRYRFAFLFKIYFDLKHKLRKNPRTRA